MPQQWIFLRIALWKIITLTYILVFLFSFLQNYLFLIANVWKILNMNFSRFTPAVLLVCSIMGTSTLLWIEWILFNNLATAESITLNQSHQPSLLWSNLCGCWGRGGGTLFNASIHGLAAWHPLLVMMTPSTSIWNKSLHTLQIISSIIPGFLLT
jgi:hypothetical protein